MNAVASGPTRGGSGSYDQANPKRGAGEVTIVAHDIGPVGGMERVLTELIVGLRSIGHPVTVIARTCELPLGTEVKFHRVRGPRRPFAAAYPWFLLAGSIAVRRWRRGIVQATGAIVLNRVDVISVHYCHQAGPAHPSRSSPLFKAHTLLVRLLKRAGERVCFALNAGATFACVSEGVADEIREHYPRLAAGVLTIHNGVDTNTFAPGRYRDEARALREHMRIDDARLIAAFVGSEWERKGLGALLRALALSPAWTAVVAGDGDTHGYGQLAEELGVAAAVRWLGVRGDVELVYALADAFVLPSSYETFSLAAFEAAASGVPVLATPVNGVRELIRDGYNGFTISRDPADIAHRLDQLAADPALRRRLGHAARASAQAFSWEATVARHHELYVRLAADGSARIGAAKR